MPTSARRRLGLALVLVAAGTTAGKAVLNHLFDDFKQMGEYASRSVTEARRRGVLVSELVVEPAELDVDGFRVRFGDAWVEERSQPSHCLVWFPCEDRKEGYRLHFTLLEAEDFVRAGYVIVPAGMEVGVGILAAGDDSMIFTVNVPNPDAADMRMSAIKTNLDRQMKNIRFRPK